MPEELEEINEEEQLEQIKELFAKLVISRKVKVDISLDLSEIEDKLKQDIAEAKDLKKKDGTVDLKQVKMTLVKNAIAIEKLKEENKLAQKYEQLEEYLVDLANSVYNDDIIETYLNKLDLVNDNKEEIDEIKDVYAATLSSDTIKAVDKLAKIVEKEYLAIEKAKLDDTNGKSTKEKDKTKSIDIDLLVMELAKKLNVKIK